MKYFIAIVKCRVGEIDVYADQHDVRCGYACGHCKGVSCENRLIPNFSDDYSDNES